MQEKMREGTERNHAIALNSFPLLLGPRQNCKANADINLEEASQKASQPARRTDTASEEDGGICSGLFSPNGS